MNGGIAKYVTRASLFTGLVFSLGCKDPANNENDDLKQMQREEIEAFLSENDLEASRHNDGFYYIPVREDPDGIGQGTGKVLGIYYTMSIMGGQEVSFYQEGNGSPLRLKQGENAVVPVGLDTGLDLMREGEIYRFILPSDQAFGDLKFSTLIPENSIIDVVVELVTIESEQEILNEEITEIDNYVEENNLNNLTVSPVDSVKVLNSGLRYKRTVEGTAGDTPSNRDEVTITYRGTFLDNSEFDATTGNDTFEFSLGVGEVLVGLDEGAARMERGERALLIMPSSLAYGAGVRVIPEFLIDDMIERSVVPDFVAKVPPFRVLVFEVRLVQ